MKEKNNQRLIAVILSVVMVLVLMPIGAMAEDKSTFFSGGDGTSTNPYQVSNLSQLNYVREDMDASYKLISDIDMSGISNWHPIGTEEKPFLGSFDGNGHSLNGLQIVDKNGTNCNNGLFGCIRDSSISNVTLNNGYLLLSEFEMGDYSWVQNCGLLVGFSDEGIITNCSIQGSIEIGQLTTEIEHGASVSVGGIAGVTSGRVSNSTSNVDIIIEDNSSVFYTGGIVGDSYRGSLIKCKNYGNSKGHTYHTGGIVGNSSGNVLSCENYGNVFADTNRTCCAGGIAGYQENSSGKGNATINSCINYGEVLIESDCEEKGYFVPPYICAGGICGNVDSRNKEEETLSKETITDCINYGAKVDCVWEKENDSLKWEDYVNLGRICGGKHSYGNMTHDEVDYSFEEMLKNNYSVSSTNLNGAPALYEIGQNKRNGATLEDASQLPVGESNELVFSNDVWNFGNFGHKNCQDKMSTADITALTEGCSSSTIACVNELLKRIGKGGHCFGMSLSVILEKIGEESICKDFSLPTLRTAEKNGSTSNCSIESLICYYQVCQAIVAHTSAVQQYRSLPAKEQIAILAKEADLVKTGGIPVLLEFGCSQGGHAVVAYAVEPGTFVSNSSKKTYNHRVLLYDCNAVDWKANYCLLFNEGTDEWEIPAYYAYGASSSSEKGYLKSALNDYSVLTVNDRKVQSDEVKKRQKAEAIIRRDALFEMIDENTKEQWTIDAPNFEFGGPRDLLFYHDSAIATQQDMSESQDLHVVLPDESGDYSFIPDEGSESTVEIALRESEKYYSLSCPTTKKVTMSSSANTVEIDDCDGAFRVCISDDNTSNKNFDTYVVSGNADGKVSVEKTDDGIVLEGDKIEGVKVEYCNADEAPEPKEVQFKGDNNQIKLYRNKTQLVDEKEGNSENADSPKSNETPSNQTQESSAVKDPTSSEKEASSSISENGFKRGLIKGSDGKWAVYKDNKVDVSVTGIVKNDFGWWRVEKGYVNFNANSIYKNQYGWWKTTDGKVTFKETGVFKNEYGWWRVEDSKVNFKANGIYKNPYGWWKTTNGKVTFKENGVFKNEYGWWKVKDSKVDFSFTGIASNKNGKWYIKNGKVDFSKNGKVKYNGTTYTIKNGKVQ